MGKCPRELLFSYHKAYLNKSVAYYFLDLSVFDNNSRYTQCDRAGKLISDSSDKSCVIVNAGLLALVGIYIDYIACLDSRYLAYIDNGLIP